VAEHLFVKKEMTPSELKRLSRIDAVYGLSALTLLAAGLTLWLGGVGKPTAFYSGNWIFHLKVTLFAIVGILSIYPTIFFIKGSKKTGLSVTVPASVIWTIRIEILILFFIPVLAGLMAKGIGLRID